jgi:hypothetical protein
MQAQAGDDMSEEALLDWLCLHVDPADLPKRFAGESMSRRAAAGIKVMSIADEEVAAQRRQEPVSSTLSVSKVPFQAKSACQDDCGWFPRSKQV